MNVLQCIAVDDEPLALGLVCAFIEKTPFLSLTGRYSSAVEALQVIHTQQIDVIFLDIQMPDLTGIELARVIEKAGGRAPRIIFTTAFNQYALDGFRVDALDYLLKPFNYEEFLRAASKAQAYAELLQKASSAGSVETKDEYLFLKVEYQLVRIAYDDILYTEGLKDYVKVHLKSDPKPILSLTSLKALEEKLPSSKFMRVHRSFIVNLDKISAVTKNTIQIGTITIPVSDQYKENFNQFLSKWM
ncbi:Transcriptional regulatory protein YpdB [Dyadobacter sp. CECT 9623]|jgi:two-component system response regulator LytT|uniref:Transcriptional regulatory protein YpdB n=1 Tax=Dyadobacter linearis TaxID=2823330 RepID=A0ABN7RDB3_9BACT|nr:MULTISPECIES: LytTR family DNA-binding domain-containing protein [unclassified Dyadobacter]MCE7063567.1 LytTR family DNA-binding domain-containing protein [Dyadobacter sp. CY343]CAG5073327.1 Transcriptional regulatory protein YpdB [Dyadobacter sp. CECT 9623]